jgi:hypothetical protein
VGGQRHAPAPLSPGKTRYLIYRRLGGTHSRSGQVRKISPPTGIRSPDRPGRSESLHRLSCSGSERYSVPAPKNLTHKERMKPEERGHTRKSGCGNDTLVTRALGSSMYVNIHSHRQLSCKIVLAIRQLLSTLNSGFHQSITLHLKPIQKLKASVAHIPLLHQEKH